jgi:hypothetical protein
VLTTTKEFVMYESNPYYSPEKMGLTLIDMVDYSSGDYEFDYRIVWQHEDGTFLTARDSGCSCPCPFENHTTLQDLDILVMDDLTREVRSDGRTYLSVSDRMSFLRKVEKALRESSA